MSIKTFTLHNEIRNCAELWTSAINLQSASAKIWLGLVFAIQN
jgi:hypothetical protein